MNLGIEGKTALVVGASRGMGAAVSQELWNAGCKVLDVARSEMVDKSLACGVYRTDISQPENVANLADAVLRHHGAPDIVVHVAGGSMGIRDHTLPASEWAKVWYMNLGAAIDLNRAFLPIMVSRGWGRIVHFSSNGVKLATGRAPYTSAKAAVESYVEVMAREYSKHGVVISAVAPGPIFTPGLFLYEQSEGWTKAFFEKYMPIGRWGQAQEVAGAVALLCSQQASYMAGAIVSVDGGMR